MAEQDWTETDAEVNGITIHYVRNGQGRPLILLHGWPEFHRIWRHNIGPLGERFDVVAPDLRGFGDSSKPDAAPEAAYRAEDHALDLKALADHLDFQRFGLVAHDIGAYVAQAFARKHPERLTGLFFFDCPYPGIGKRWRDADHIKEIWYQTFNTLEIAPKLVGHSRETCEIYFRHFLDHWAYKPGRFSEEDIAAWVDNYMKPGNLAGGFAWYSAARESRLEMMRHGAPILPKISVPTRVRWGEGDSVLRADWADRLGDYFTDVDVKPFPEAGHFGMYERPVEANHEIIDFFEDLDE